MMREIGELLTSKGIQFDPSELEIKGYTKDMYKANVNKDAMDGVFAVSVPEKYADVINQWLSEQEKLSIAEYNWINRPSKHPSPYLTALQKGSTELKEIKSIAHNAHHIPVYEKQPDRSLVLVDKEAKEKEVATKTIEELKAAAPLAKEKDNEVIKEDVLNKEQKTTNIKRQTAER